MNRRFGPKPDPDRRYQPRMGAYAIVMAGDGILGKITRGAASNDYSLSSLVAGVVTSTPFQMRMARAEPEAE